MSEVSVGKEGHLASGLQHREEPWGAQGPPCARTCLTGCVGCELGWYSSSLSGVGVHYPHFTDKPRKAEVDYLRHTTSSWQNITKTQGRSQGLLSTQHCWLKESRQKNEAQEVGPQEADS